MRLASEYRRDDAAGAGRFATNHFACGTANSVTATRIGQRPELRAAALAHAKQDIARKLMGAMAR